LKIDNNQLPVTAQTEVDQPVYWNKGYFYTALCFATRCNNRKIVDALLSIGANPHLTSNRIFFGSILLIAASNKETLELFKLFLTIPNIDPYVSDCEGDTVFYHTKGNTKLILDLLSLDPAVAVLPESEKAQICEAIGTAVKDQIRFQANNVLCQSLNKSAYKDYVAEEDQKLIADCVNQVTGLVKHSQPVRDIILSYLFIKKPHSLLALEEATLRNSPGAAMTDQLEHTNDNRSVTLGS
jgi:hypothetical protein